MKVITLLNEKGGVGKTTLAINLACGLTLRGHRTIFIDADAQADATRVLGLPAYGALYNLLVRPNDPEGEWNKCLRRVGSDTIGGNDKELYVVTSNLETRNIANSVESGDILHERLSEVASVFEYVIIDAPPTPDLFHAILLATSDYVIVPTQAEIQSFGGVVKTIEHARKVNQKVGGAQVIGIIPNMYRNTVAHQNVLAQMQEDYSDLVWDKISLSTVFPEAALMNQSIFAYAPDTERANDMWAIVDRTIGIMING